MVMTSDETQIQVFASWPMSHAKRVTRDNRKNSEYLRTDTNCPAGKSWPNHVKNVQHIGSEKTYGCIFVRGPLELEDCTHNA